MLLASHEEVLELQGDPDIYKGVTFSGSHYLASTVTINFVRWIEMGQPHQVTVKVIPGTINDVVPDHAPWPAD